MQIHNVEQGTPDWFELRKGIPTASNFSKILTPTGRLSTSKDTYLYELLSESVLGYKEETTKTEWMERGNELEEEAAVLYELATDIDTEIVGFITNNGVGCSPDRLVGKEGLLEIKCPKPSTHTKYIVSQKMDNKYIPQVQGQLMVTGRKWCDWMSYHPELPPVIVRVERDEKYIEKLSTELEKFLKEFKENHEIIKNQVAA
jgi:hypothetical protein